MPGIQEKILAVKTTQRPFYERVPGIQEKILAVKTKSEGKCPSKTMSNRVLLRETVVHTKF